MGFFRKKKSQKSGLADPIDDPMNEEPVIIDAMRSSASDSSPEVVLDPETTTTTTATSNTNTNAPSETPYQRQEDEEDDNDQYEILGKIPKFLLPKVATVGEKRRLVLMGGAVLLVLLLALVTLSATSGNANLAEIGGGTTFNPNFFYASKQSVAFVGNMNFVLNDLPRLVQTISGNKITQDSCLHQKGNLFKLLKTGNGMLERWTTDNAILSTSQYTGNTIYDYGACSVPQLLLGSDDTVSYRNQYGSFYDDGTNPCLNDEDYYDFRINQKNQTESWDFIVMTDQAKRMCFEYSRQQSLMALNFTYAPILNQVGAKPIIVQPHAFWSDNDNMTGLTDIPTFTSLIYEGTQEYKSFLDSNLPNKQQARIAPVGNAFLAIYDEYPDLYQSLFLSEGVHPSPIGTLLYSLCIYASVYGTMPPRSNVYLDDMSQLFSNSRKLYSEGSNSIPTKSQAKTLYKIARRITLKGYKPSSLVTD
jgi:hypothetical protein